MTEITQKDVARKLLSLAEIKERSGDQVMTISVADPLGMSFGDALATRIQEELNVPFNLAYANIAKEFIRQDDGGKISYTDAPDGERVAEVVFDQGKLEAAAGMSYAAVQQRYDAAEPAVSARGV